MRSLRQRHTIYSVRDDLAKGAATIVAKDGAKQTTECWQVFGQVVTLAGERLPFVACRRCLTPYADDPSGSTGNLIRHLAKCQNSDSTATQISSPEMMPTKDVVIKKEPLNDSEMDNASDSDAFALSSISQEAALEAALSVRDQLQPVALTPRRVKERLSKEELIIVYKTGVKQTTECWQVIGQVATTEGIPLPFLACRRCLQVYSDDPNGSTSTLNRHLLRCTATAATNGKNGVKLLSPKEEEMEHEEGEECEERPTGSAISLQDSIVPMPVYQDHDDVQEEIELDQAQSIGLAAIDVLFGAGATRSSRPKTPNGSDQWSCEVAGCPLTFLTRNGMLKHCRKKHSLSKRNAQPTLVGKPNAATLMTMQLREASAAALPVQGVVLENSPPTSSTSRWADAPHLPPPTITTNASSTRFRCSVDGCFRQFLTANGMRKHRRKCHSSIKYTDGRSIRWSKPMSSKVSSMNGFSASKAGSQLKQTKSVTVTRVASAANGFHRQEEASNQLTTSTLYDSFPSGVKLIAHDPIQQVTCAPPFVPE
uniref:Zinc finger protein n=1 Tax=Plectus sambesii TaxID=2011161 RepID=A0A914X327_9BILA